jgi:hypothetical protein
MIAKMTDTKRKKSRRTFFQKTGDLLVGAGLGLSLPTIVPRSVLAGSKEGAPSDRINVGSIGIRNQGGGNLRRYCKKLWMGRFQAAVTWGLSPSMN